MNVLPQKQRIAVLDALQAAYPQAQCALEHGSIFELLTAVVLSAQTTDKSVNAISPALFERYPDPATLAAADPRDVEEILRSIGMYRTKTKNILALAAMLLEKFDGQVPGTYEELVRLPGVGRKTANVVLSVGFGEQRIAVDTHVFRVTNRIGLCHEKDVLKTELALMENLPQDRWTEAHHTLIFHGRQCCHARKPACERCPVGDLCLYLAGIRRPDRWKEAEK